MTMIGTDRQMELARDFVLHTQRNVFLTGKAGTGKTTFLLNLRNLTPKRMIVVAPTGVAAINAGGVTIHSFFQLPFGPLLPESLRALAETPQEGKPTRSADYKRFSREKIRLIKSLDLLVIDEISMVRADLLDAIDETLRRFKDRGKPFGGAQVLMIGDLHQLSPVAKEQEWEMLRERYDSVYFFSSSAFRQCNPVCIELKHVFRQSDQDFINLLNAVRNNAVDAEVMQQLNQRFLPGFKPKEAEGYITLTTHNANAAAINASKLKELPHKSKSFTATVEGDFPAFSYPTEQELELKTGAQVMFVKNDISREKLFYNGKIGRIERFEEGLIVVKCPGDDAEIPVERVAWNNMKYSLDERTKEVRENEVGVFIQYPLKLAWAITIHKSQGLTFDKAIIDAAAAFAFGQVYVALSRCRSLEGLVLSTRITQSGIKTDSTVSGFNSRMETDLPGESQLEDSKKSFQHSLLRDLFDYAAVQQRFGYLKKLVKTHEQELPPGAMTLLTEAEARTATEIYGVLDKFRQQLEQLSAPAVLPEQNQPLQERVKKACAYFAEKTDACLYAFTQQLHVEADNKETKKTVSTALENLQKEVFIRLQCLTACKNGFQAFGYIKSRADSELDFRYAGKRSPAAEKVSLKNVPHPELYKALVAWRKDLAEQNDYPVFMILPQKTLLQLVKHLPVTLTELAAVKGLGDAKVKQFGDDITELIAGYCLVNHVQRPKIEVAEKKVRKKAPKPDTKKLSFELFRAGKSVAEIAAERGFVMTTVEGHLAHFVGTGELSVFDFVSKEKLETITGFFDKNPEAYSSQAKEALGPAVTWSDIRFVQSHLKSGGQRNILQ